MRKSCYSCRHADDQRVQKAFSSWLDHTRRWRRNRAVVQRSTALASMCVKKFAFNAWWLQHEAHIAWRRKLLLIGRKRSHETLRTIFFAWKGVAADLRAKDQVMQYPAYNKDGLLWLLTCRINTIASTLTRLGCCRFLSSSRLC